MDEVFKTLLEEVEATEPESFPPAHEIANGEQVLEGVTVSDFARRAYSLSRYYARERDRAEVEHKYTSYKEDPCDAAHAALREFDAKVSLLMEIFWLSVRQRCWQEENIGVRGGWVIVRTRNEKKYPPGLKALFGGLIE